jgi:hypothetical protein
MPVIAEHPAAGTSTIRRVLRQQDQTVDVARHARPSQQRQGQAAHDKARACCACQHLIGSGKGARGKSTLSCFSATTCLSQPHPALPHFARAFLEV